jgi:pilus assembly protein CpaC
VLLPAGLSAQGTLPAPLEISTVDLSAGRSFPIQSPVAITRVTVANPDVADVVVVGERDVIVNAKATGETDVILIGAGQFRRQYRVRVRTAGDRRQIVLGVKIAEVRRDALTTFGVSGLSRGNNARVGSSTFSTDQAINPTTGAITLEGTRFLSVLTDFGTRVLLALIEAEATRGRARVLAEPTLMAADRDSASFLSGGEIPIPIATPGLGGLVQITIQYREFGVRLTFVPEILNDSLIKLRVRPEVSSLDFANALLLSGFRIPALRTRRVESTVDVRRDRSLVISGLFNDEREQVRTGIPLLMNIPILGNLFSSTRWQRNETELVIVVTPMVVDPMRPRAQDAIRLQPDTTLPAREVIQPRLSAPTAPAPSVPPRRP